MLRAELIMYTKEVSRGMMSKRRENGEGGAGERGNINQICIITIQHIEPQRVN